MSFAQIRQKLDEINLPQSGEKQKLEEILLEMERLCVQLGRERQELAKKNQITQTKALELEREKQQLQQERDLFERDKHEFQMEKSAFSIRTCHLSSDLEQAKRLQATFVRERFEFERQKEEFQRLILDNQMMQESTVQPCHFDDHKARYPIPATQNITGYDLYPCISDENLYFGTDVGGNTFVVSINETETPQNFNYV